MLFMNTQARTSYEGELFIFFFFFLSCVQYVIFEKLSACVSRVTLSNRSGILCMRHGQDFVIHSPLSSCTFSSLVCEGCLYIDGLSFKSILMTIIYRIRVSFIYMWGGGVTLLFSTKVIASFCFEMRNIKTH